MKMKTYNTLDLNEAKRKLPKQYMAIMIHFFPEVDGDEGLQTKIRNIMQGRGSDDLWVNRIIYVAEHYKQPGAPITLDIDGMTKQLRDVVAEHIKPFA